MREAFVAMIAFSANSHAMDLGNPSLWANAGMRKWNGRRWRKKFENSRCRLPSLSL